MRVILAFVSSCAAFAVWASNMMTPWGEKVLFGAGATTRDFDNHRA